MVNASEILDIVEMVCYAPAFPLSVYVCIKHGFKREAGFLVLLILSVIRIVGSACGIAASKENNLTLYEVSLIMSSVGSAALVGAFTGITNRIADGSKGSPFSPQQRKLLQMIGLVAIILGIVGGTQISDTDRNAGSSYREAASILILIQFLATCVVFGFCAVHFRHILDVDRKLFFCVALAIPFLFVRVLYSILAAFDMNSSTFSMLSTTVVAVAVRACLAIAMEVVAVYLFILGGIFAPKVTTGQRSLEAEASTQQEVQLEGKIPALPAYTQGRTNH